MKGLMNNLSSQIKKLKEEHQTNRMEKLRQHQDSPEVMVIQHKEDGNYCL